MASFKLPNAKSRGDCLKDAIFLVSERLNLELLNVGGVPSF